MMKRFLRFAFLGESFHGTQKQPHDQTIQGLFEELLSRIYGQDVKVTIASRLDRGVHALDFAITFDLPNDSISDDHLFYYLKRSLGKDVFLKEMRKADDSFSPRYDCLDKQYLYLIQEKKNPLLNPLSYSPKYPLDIEKLVNTLSLMKGKHDFRYFSTPEDDDNTILEMKDVSVVEEDGLIKIRFVSKSFLRYQVRFMVGSGISVAIDRLDIHDVMDALEMKKELPIKYKAEPQGLFLEKINYPDIKDDNPIEFILG